MATSVKTGHVCGVCRVPLTPERVNSYPLQWQHSGPMHCKMHENRAEFLPIKWFYNVRKLGPKQWTVEVRLRDREGRTMNAWKNYYTQVDIKPSRREAEDIAKKIVRKLYRLV